ncbi:hypothetical protein MBLNU459_g4798t2 [Dothideomycetes sp. NU459]
MDVGFFSLYGGSQAFSWTSTNGSTISMNRQLPAAYNQSIIPSNSYGIHVGAASQNVSGSLVLGGYDRSRCLTSPIITSSSAFELSDIGIGVETGGSAFLGTVNGSASGLLKPSSSTGLTVKPNPGVPYLYLPQDTCDAIASHLPVTFNPDLGLYTWNTDDPAFSKIVNSPSYLSFTFKSSGDNNTIYVPFALLNLTLESPIVNSATQYFPCSPYSPSAKQAYHLGRAFLQAAFLAKNWATDTIWLAQAPGPDTPPIQVTTISPSDNTLAAMINAPSWYDTWSGTLEALPSSSTPSATATVAPGSSSSGSISGGAIAGITTSTGQIINGSGLVTATIIEPNVVRVSVNTGSHYVGARFCANSDAAFYGVWEYPWFGGITNTNVSFELKGLGDSTAVNWSNARAPFFFSDAGYGVYADSLGMSSFDFTTPGEAQFIFNTSTLVFYVILPDSPDDYKSILQTYTRLSARIEMPPDSGYGPTFWSDDFEQDFHGNVMNAQENYYDVINHLYFNQIHATAMFADRPYGTGNSSFGNFDFDPAYYPSPEQFIANLTTWGFDFQVWVANRAFLDTELFNVSVENDWLFPGYNPDTFLGPALNLSIPAAYGYFKKRLSYFPSVGVKGYKIDRGEEGEMPVYEQNIQQTLFEQLCYESMVEVWGEDAFYNFARSAVDRSRARSGIRAGLIGFPIWASDTGGYIREPYEPSQELWARWMHFSTFSPVYELMLGTNHTPYYPPYTSELVSVLKETANLHHSLLPFIRSYTYQATVTGLPLMRAIFLECPSDKSVYTTTDEYFFGSEFLVAPIVSAGGVRSVYFPAGTSYLEYFNKTSVYHGGCTETVSMDVHYVPVYVRAGAIVPRGDIFQGNNKWTEDWEPELTIEIYPAFGTPLSIFKYYNGEARKEVDIRVETREGTVTVEYGAVGIAGTIVVYTKTGQRNATLKADGGVVVMDGIESLFSNPGDSGPMK